VQPAVGVDCNAFVPEKADMLCVRDLLQSRQKSLNSHGLFYNSGLDFNAELNV
jgi:hypothetical protein